MMLLIKICLVFVLVICVFVFARLFVYRTALIYVLRRWTEWIDDWVHVHQYLKVPQVNGNGQENQLYRNVYLYVNSLASLEDSDFTNLFSGEKSNDIVLCLDDGQVVPDTFLGARVSWVNKVVKDEGCYGEHARFFVLKMRKKDKRRILKPYLQHILTVAEDIHQRSKQLKLFINNSLAPSDGKAVIGRWRSFPFTHPSTFDTIAMDADLKAKIKSDLETFLKSKQHYHKLGRVWKRSYLLYGPSGTGKSSFVAAMARFLHYDVYDVDLFKVSDDSDLKLLLLQTKPKSLMVIEDLDQYLSTKSTAGISLSCLLNFMDGMMNSCCGDEKIMVFTMNCKDQVDPTVLRPGRIDVHIYFPPCDFNSFKSLASSYLGIKEHKLFPQVEEIFQSGATMSPAEIGELMLANRSSPSRALRSVIAALQSNGGDGRVAGRRVMMMPESVSSSPALPYTEEQGGGGWTDGVPVAKEFRKLYGMLRLKSSKKSGPLDRDSPMIGR